SADDRKEADDMLVALKQYVAPLRLSAAEADASVFVDDELVGKTPLASPVLVDFGKVTLRVTKPGFAEYREVLEVKDQGEVVKTVALEKPEGRLVVTSRDDATIDIDGKFVSRGRLVATLAFGGHQLKITATGYRAFQTEVVVDAKERSLDITLEKEKGGGLPAWAWIGGSVLLVGGLSVGGYFIYRAATSANGFPAVAGNADGVQLSGFRW
ncbi:MAG TPA: PEGA domain-containing protein, partial [Polyangiaceae bacterium]